MTERDSGYLLEVVDRSGQVHQRVELDEQAIILGRGYDSDVIIDDAYLCAHHVSIRLDADGRLIVTALGSVNGLSAKRHGARVPALVLQAGDDCYIGWTKLRFRSRQGEVTPALIDHSQRLVYGALQQPVSLLLLIAVPFLHLVYITWLEQASEVSWHTMLIAPATIYAVLGLWAFIWAIVGRVLVHRAMFLTHLAIGTAMTTVSLSIETVVSYVMFAFDIDSLRAGFLLVSGTLVSVAVLYLHLHFATRLKPRMQVTTAVAVSLMISVVSVYVEYTSRDIFHDTPAYTASLKPPAFVIGTPRSADDFFSSLDELKQEVDQQKEDD